MSTARLPQTLFWGYAILLSALLLAPGPAIEEASIINDKLAHTLAFALFSTLAAASYDARAHYLRACVAIAAYSLVMEAAQYTVPGREVSALDASANLAGVLLGVVLGFGYRHWR